MKQYYISLHGGEGWENVVDEDKISDEVDTIIKYWPGIPASELIREIYIFPMESRIELVDMNNGVPNSIISCKNSRPHSSTG